eukprot:1158943-Pelagomonas_calceolata.AAC.5
MSAMEALNICISAKGGLHSDTLWQRIGKRRVLLAKGAYVGKGAASCCPWERFGLGYFKELARLSSLYCAQGTISEDKKAS